VHSRYDFGSAVLSGVVSYKRNYGTHFQDSDMSPLPVLDVNTNPFSRSWYGEVLLTSPADRRLTWIAGVTGFSDLTEARPQFNPQFNGGVRSYYGVRTRAASAFGEVTLEALDNLFLTAGLRGTTEEKLGFNTQVTLANVVTAQVKTKDSWKAAVPRFVARYEFSPNNNAYASYSEGFKSGTFDASSLAGAGAPVDPEKVKAYEAGIKTSPTPRTRLNLAVFRYDYSKLQVVVISTSQGLSFSRLQNAADARIYGAELEGAFQVTDDFRVGLTMSHLDTRFGSFPNASVSEPRMVNGLPSGNVTVTRDVTGNRLIRAPNWTVGLSANYSVAAFGGDVTIDGSLFHSTKFYVDINNREHQPAYTVVNATVTWRDRDRGLWASLQGRNLTDELVLSQLFVSGSGDFAAYQKPSNWLVTLGYDF
jgi:iron complex outermembrane receptor protein